ncbi:MAG: outer membrane beta-barrel protein [Xanthomonadales bacterium]|nr:outer membrane beta-barrel protein [Xanthomonadales bacterium]
MKTIPALLAVALAAALPQAAQAEDWFFRAGIHTVNPDSDNGSLARGALDVDIGSDTQPTFVLGRMLDEHWGLELLAALPFQHDVRLNGDKALEFKHLPPTLSVQYYFAPGAKVRPFVGAGLNYTWTFEEDESGALDGTKVSIDNSFGFAGQLGLAVDLSPKWHLVFDARWIDIDADVSVNGDNVGSVQVDPWVYGAYIGYRF